MSLADLLFDHPFADDEGLLYTPDQTVTAGQARGQAADTASALTEHGIGPGRAVAVQLPSSPRAVTTMMGIWRAGCVFVPVNPRAPETEVQRIVGQLEAAALVTTQGIEPVAEGRRYEQGVGFVLWTSGTTGAPKPILHTHDGYLEILDRVLGQLRPDPERAATRPAPNLIPVPLNLNSGIYNVLFGLRAGAALVLMERFDPGRFAELVRRFAVRSTVLPPAAIAMLNADPGIADLAPLRYVRSITAPLTPGEARRFTERFGVFVLNGYGQSEIGEVIGWTARDAREHPEKVGAAGRPHPGVDIRLDADGRLWVRPPSRAAGYASGDELTDRIDAEGYLDTGDLARVDEDGFVWIEGRAGDVINRGGNKIHPQEVEDVIGLVGGITGAAVVGRPDPRLGQVPIAFYQGRPRSENELTTFCREHLVPYKIPVAFHWIEELPRNDAGKVVRAALTEPETQ